MAWFKLFRIPFQSRGGTQYMVYIYGQTTSPLGVATLTGAAAPFVTSENDDDDIFTPMRSQTGYLRVIDTDGTLMSRLTPESNTERMVRLYTGTWNADFSTFTDGDIKWQGFLCAEAYTQPWDNQAKVIELPVKSLLAALEDVQIPDTEASSERTFGQLIYSAFGHLVATPFNCTIMSNMHAYFRMLQAKLQLSTFFNEVTIYNQGDSYQQLVGMSYAEAIASVAALFGVCLRDNGDGIAISMYDKNGCAIICGTYPWSDFINISDGTYNTYIDAILSETDALTAMTFRGSDNVEGFMQGSRSAKVTVDINVDNGIIALPSVTQDRSQIYQKTVNGDQILYVQAHPNRTNARETFTYIKQYRYTAVTTTDYSEMLECSWIAGYTYNPYYSSSTAQVTGVFPCRYFLRKTTGEVPVLKDGLYMSCQYPYSGQGSRTTRFCYSIKSTRKFQFDDGWIVIDLGIIPTFLNRDDGTIICNNQEQETEFKIVLKVGNQFFNGTNWVTGSDAIANSFTIKCKGNTVISNKTIDMETDVSGGFFIPVSGISGEVKIYILNDVYSNPAGSPLQNYLTSCLIIENVDVVYSPRYDMASSSRGSNTYYQQILSTGFSEDKNIGLVVGTFNNNVAAPCFIRDANNAYIETFEYYNADATDVVTERPEMNLLGRMVEQCGCARRTFRAVVQSALDLIGTRYTMLSKAFFGVDAQHNWRDDEQEVKLIEVT